MLKMDSVAPTVEQASFEAIVKGSKSFSLASLFFAKREREACHLLYHFCRHCDDVIDTTTSLAAAHEALAKLRTDVSDLASTDAARPLALEAFRAVQNQYRIPTAYLHDLLSGFETDANGSLIADENDLMLYSYRVAGVVGLMMCHIMALNDQAARQQAVELGLAMQLTNIARDIKEDFERGRVYLPRTWLTDAGIEPERLMTSDDQLYAVVLRLLSCADELYAAGLTGLKALPLRAALAVSIATSVYSGIGTQIRKRGPAALGHRVYLTSFEKAGCAVRGFFRIIPLSFARLVRRWEPAPLEDLWQFKTQRT